MLFSKHLNFLLCGVIFIGTLYYLGTSDELSQGGHTKTFVVREQKKRGKSKRKKRSKGKIEDKQSAKEEVKEEEKNPIEKQSVEYPTITKVDEWMGKVENTEKVKNTEGFSIDNKEDKSTLAAGGKQEEEENSPPPDDIYSVYDGYLNYSSEQVDNSNYNYHQHHKSDSNLSNTYSNENIQFIRSKLKSQSSRDFGMLQAVLR